MGRPARFSGWENPRRLFRSATKVPYATFEEQVTGWPAYLCGGWLEMEYEDSEHLREEHIEGTLPVLPDWEDDEDPEAYAISSFTIPLDAWDNHTRDHWSLQQIWRNAAPGQNKKGRPEGSRNLKAGSSRLPQARGSYRDAVIAASRELFERAPAPFPWADLERVVTKILHRSVLAPPSPPPNWQGDDEGFETIWLPELNTFSELREWAFTWSLPKEIERREAVVRAFEFLLYVKSVPWECTGMEKSTLIALASLAGMAISGEDFVARGQRGRSRNGGYRYSLSMAVAAEQRAIRFVSKRIAEERLRRV